MILEAADKPAFDPLDSTLLVAICDAQLN